MGFYGNLANVARTTFSFDKTYSTRFEMVLKCATDGVFIGRYVLLDYDHEDEEDDDFYKLTQLVQYLINTDKSFNWDIIEAVANEGYKQAYTGQEITLDDDTYYILIDMDNLKSPILLKGETPQEVTLDDSISDWYNSHYYIDKKIFDAVGRGWDSTVWQKTYKDDNLGYVMIAELNGVVPTIDILNDPPVWLEGIGNDNSDLIDGEYTYRTTEEYMTPYFDEEDKTNLYYRLHMQSPWKFGNINVTGLENPEEGAVDDVSLNYTSSGKEYSYEIGKTGTAVDTINFSFALPSIGNALKEINTLLYGENGSKTVNPASHHDSESDVNDICYFPSSGDLNPDAFKSIAGALNTAYDILGSNITSTPSKDSEDNNIFPEGFIYYAKYSDLIDLIGKDENLVDDGDRKQADDDIKYYWCQYIDTDRNSKQKRYRELKGYPSYNNILLAFNQQAADALDTVNDLRRLADLTIGIPNTLLVTDSDYRAGGVNLIGDDIVNINNLSHAAQKNYLPYPNWWTTTRDGVRVYDKKVENGLTFEVDQEDKHFTISGTAIADTELIIARNVYLPLGNYIFSGSTGGSDTTYGLKAVKNDDDSNNDYTLYSGETSIPVDKNDFYFDYISVFVKAGTNLSETAAVFYPMIREASATADYATYKNEYEINIKHKQVEGPIDNPKYTNKNDEDGNPITELANKYTVYAPTVDSYGHVTKMSGEALPNYYSNVLLRDSNIEDQKIYLTASSIGDELNLAKIQGMNFSADGNDLIFRPTVDVSFSTSEPIFQDQTANIGNEATWRKFTVVTGIGFDSNKLALDVKGREIPFPLSHISVAPRPTLETESGAKVIDFDWSNIASTGIQPTGIYEPEYRAYSPEEGVKIPSRIVSFAPADDIIKLGIWQDSSRIDSSSWWDVRRVLIGHGKPEGLKSLFNENSQNLLVGEINNLFYRQTSRIPELVEGASGSDGQEIPKWRTNINDFFTTYPKITEKINLTKADDAENGVFSTLSLKVDKSGHIVGLQEINVKLIFNNILNNFMAPKAISPFVTKYFHNEPVAEDGYGYGAYCIGDRIYLNENESIYNYLYIGIRSGVQNASPGGSGIKMDYFPSNQVVTQHPIQIMFYCNAATYMISLKWFKEEESGAEYFEVVGNTSFYVYGNLRKVNSDGSVSNTFDGEFRATQGIREYADDDSSNTTKESTFGSPVHTPYAVVSADQDMNGNKKSWLKESTAWLKRHAPGSNNLDKDIQVSSPYDPTGQYVNAAHFLRAASKPGIVGIRRIFGIGNLSALSDSDAIEPDDIDEEAINQDISQQESNYYDDGNNGNSGE